MKRFSKFFFLLFIVNCSLLTVHCSLLIAQNKLDVVVIDAGHGGKDPGTIGVTGVQEKNIVLPIALKLGELISQKFPEIKVLLTRSSDEFPSLKDRTNLANNIRAKLFISIHANHKKKEENEKNGFEVYLIDKQRFPEALSITMNDNNMAKFQKYGNDTTDNFIFANLARSGIYKLNEILASKIEFSMVNNTQLASRGVFQADLWVLLGSSIPSVLVETGYVSDANEEKYLSSSAGQTAIANALYNAFVNYKSIFEIN